jgi:serine/threonine protein kinase
MGSEPNTLDDARVGTRVGDYLIDALIGVGGMGKVYRATAGDGTRVALKLVKEDLAFDEIFRRRFAREARIAHTIRNPHVVPVLDTGEHEGLPYLAAKFIDGVALDKKLRLEGKLDLPSTVKVCAQVADGLRAMWEAGMVHRDVKPANILLDRTGRAYITDFGLAKDSRGTVLTRPGQALGSMDYMAPEQIRGVELTGAADLYALGCVAFECLQGRPPFAHRNGMQVPFAHLQEEPPDPTADRPDVPRPFAEALLTALRKDPSERPASGTEYARSLADAAGISYTEAVG